MELVSACQLAPSESPTPKVCRWVGSGLTLMARCAGKTAGRSIGAMRDGGGCLLRVQRKAVGALRRSKERGPTQEKGGAPVAPPSIAARAFSRGGVSLVNRLRARARLWRLGREIEKKEKAPASVLAAIAAAPATTPAASAKAPNIRVSSESPRPESSSEKLRAEASPFDDAFVDDLLAQTTFEFASERLAFQNAVRDARSADARVRESAVCALERIKAPAAERILMVLCGDAADAVRARSLDALLARPGHPGTIALLQAIAENDSAPNVRIAALRGLYKLAPAQSVPHMVRALADENALVRRRAVTCLAWAGAHDAVPDVIALLDDPDSDVRRAVVEALGQLQRSLSAPSLIEALGDDDAGVRERAYRSLRAVTGQDIHFNPCGTPLARARGKAHWERWWAANAGMIGA